MSVMNRTRIGTITLLIQRVYPINPVDDVSDPGTAVAALDPGDYPVYHEPDTNTIYWEGFGIPSRFVNDTTVTSLAHISRNMFAVNSGYHYEPTGDPAITIRSAKLSPEAFQDILASNAGRERFRYQPEGSQPS